MEKKEYEIELSGCDDSTIIKRWLTPDEVTFLKELEISFNEASTYSCMPTFHLRAEITD